MVLGNQEKSKMSILNLLFPSHLEYSRNSRHQIKTDKTNIDACLYVVCKQIYKESRKLSRPLIPAYEVNTDELNTDIYIYIAEGKAMLIV